MQLSTKGRYGARAMTDLAARHGQGPIMVREIAKRQQVSEKYLEQILSELRKSGLVVSFQGKKGGFQLARGPGEITLREVLEVLEGSFSPVRCVEDESYCDRVDICVMHDIWGDLRDAQLEVLANFTLDKLVDMERKKRQEQAVPDYCI